MRRSPHTAEFQIKACQDFLEGHASYHAVAAKYGIHNKTLMGWVSRYKVQGPDAFMTKEGNASYSAELKLKCVLAVLSGEGSVLDIAAKYNLSDGKVLRNWIMQYNAGRELKDYCPKQEDRMAEEKRKAALEERKKAVKYCIEHDRDYKGTAEKFGISYNRIFTWVKKYDELGEEGLVDKRGQRKADEDLDELERLRRENIRLKQKLKEKDMVVELLKKVKEFERLTIKSQDENDRNS